MKRKPREKKTLRRIDANLYVDPESGIHYLRAMKRGITRTLSLKTKSEKEARRRLPFYLRRAFEKTRENQFREAEVDHWTEKAEESEISGNHRITFAVAFERMARDYDKDPTISKGTRTMVATAFSALKKTWPDVFDFSLRELSPAAVKDWYAHLFSHYNGSPASINNVLFKARRVVDYMVDADVSKGLAVPPKNPFSVVKTLRQRSRMTIPDRETLAHVLQVALDVDPLLHEFMWMLIHTGARASEMLDVRWGDVDFKRNQITFRTAKRRMTSHYQDYRAVPMAEVLRERLKKLRDRTDPTPKEKVLGEVVYDCYRQKLKRLWKRPELADEPRFVFHDLRHTFTTRCLESKVDVPTVARWLGHVDGGALLLRTYAHLLDDHSQQSIQKVKF